MTWICECCGTEISCKPRHNMLVCPTCGSEVSAETIPMSGKHGHVQPKLQSFWKDIPAAFRRFLTCFTGDSLSPVFRKMLVAIKSICVLAVVVALVLFVVGFLRSGSTPVLFAAALQDNARYYSENTAMTEISSNLKSYDALHKSVDGVAVPENLASLFAGSQFAQGVMNIYNNFQALNKYIGRVTLNLRSYIDGGSDCISSFLSNCSDGWNSLSSWIVGLSQDLLKR